MPLTLALRFTFSLLYSPILTSITSTILIRKERDRAAKGTLTKYKYIQYQVCKILAAMVLSFGGFIGFLATPEGDDVDHAGENGTWMSGVKLNDFHGKILWLSFYNW